MKIKKMSMRTIMENANFDSGVCVLCDEHKKKRCMTFHAKGLCQKDCKHAYDHKKLPDTAVSEVYNYISDGCC